MNDYSNVEEDLKRNEASEISCEGMQGPTSGKYKWLDGACIYSKLGSGLSSRRAIIAAKDINRLNRVGS